MPKFEGSETMDRIIVPALKAIEEGVKRELDGLRDEYEGEPYICVIALHRPLGHTDKPGDDTEGSVQIATRGIDVDAMPIELKLQMVLGIGEPIGESLAALCGAESGGMGIAVEPIDGDDAALRKIPTDRMV